MVVIVHDIYGNIMAVDSCCVTGIHGAKTNNTVYLEKLQLENNEQYEERGVDGIHIIPTDESIEEIFVVCNDCDDMVQHIKNGVINLTEYKYVFNALNWKMYAQEGE